ncbi:MAG: Rab family GTPase [Promethearchaeota archaeon]
MDEIRLVFKITVVGDGGVGKTSLIKRFTESSFNKEYIKTIGAQFSVYNKQIENVNVRLLLWDIAGQDDFSFLKPSFFKNSNASIIVYSVEKTKLGENSFNHILSWYNDLKQYCSNIPTVIFANKIDLIDLNTIDDSAIQKLMKDYEFLGFYYTSAKTGQGVINAFNVIINLLYQKYKLLSEEYKIENL